MKNVIRNYSSKYKATLSIKHNTMRSLFAVSIFLLTTPVMPKLVYANADLSETNTILSVNTITHFAGYANVGYTKPESSDGSFGAGQFSPIFHFQYRDLVMLEAELEIAIDDEMDGRLSKADNSQLTNADIESVLKFMKQSFNPKISQ